MSEYREALQKLCDAVALVALGDNSDGIMHKLESAVHAAKALLARGEPEHDPALTRNDLPQNLNRIAADIEYCARKVNPAHEVHGLLIGAASALIWLRDEYLDPAAAEKAREWRPIETAPRDGTEIEVKGLAQLYGPSSYALRFTGFRLIPSPPAATGETKRKCNRCGKEFATDAIATVFYCSLDCAD